MKGYYSVILFLVLVGASVASSIDSYQRTDDWIREELSRALAKTLAEHPDFTISPDTIRTYRQHIAIAEVRQFAYITCEERLLDGRPQFRGYANVGPMGVLRLSDQRLPALLALLSAAWGTALLWRRREEAESVGTALAVATVSEPSPLVLGGLSISPTDGRFRASDGSVVHLTPMQQQLMEMFFSAPTHELTKQEICAALWPKKDNPNETLYTLIRRLKPVVEAHGVRIEADRGRSYKMKVVNEEWGVSIFRQD